MKKKSITATDALHKAESGATLIELMVVLSIIVLLMWIFYPRLYAYRTDVRTTRTQAELASLRLVVETFASGPGNGHYPKASNNPADPTSIAAILHEKGVVWGGVNGIRDPWGNPYRYYTALLSPVPFYPLSYAFVSAGSDGAFGTDDDIWTTDYDPPTVGGSTEKWFSKGNYPVVDSANP